MKITNHKLSNGSAYIIFIILYTVSIVITEYKCTYTHIPDEQDNTISGAAVQHEKQKKGLYGWNYL